MWRRAIQGLGGAALALALLTAAGCLTPQREARLGEEQAKSVEREMGLLRDDAVAGYVRALGSRLAAVSRRPEGPWQFHVVDREEPNAFALPGGYVYVTRGLLALVNSEDELAGVIGHEIAHVTARHSAKRIRAAVVTAPVSIATGIAGLAVSIVSPLLGDVVAGTGPLLTSGLVIAPFSREQENQADEIGQELAARAGYDPAGIAHFLQTLDRDATLDAGEQRSFHFLDSHPLTPDRVERTQRRASGLARAAGRPIAHGHADFLRRLDGIVVGPDPAQGVFEEQLYLHPELDIAIEFPPGWRTVDTPAAVGAVSPGEDALVALRVAAQDTSVEALVAEIQREQPSLEFERFEIRELPAARTRLRSRGQTAEVTLIGYAGKVFAVLGQSADEAAARYARAFDATARGFRALRTSERGRIRELRLRVREARAGETAAALAEWTGSAWSAEKLAVANGIDPDTALRGGLPVKVALEQAYTARRR